MASITFRELWAYERKDLRPSLEGSYVVIDGMPRLESHTPSNLSYIQLRKLNKNNTLSIDALINNLENIVAGKDMASKLEDRKFYQERYEAYKRDPIAFKESRYM